jgi:hypothetical protein
MDIGMVDDAARISNVLTGGVCVWMDKIRYTVLGIPLRPTKVRGLRPRRRLTLFACPK